jgi:2-oxo-4-hydroxy-4-carboxy-5-ureidoimidazoline decarboxylase
MRVALLAARSLTTACANVGVAGARDVKTDSGCGRAAAAPGPAPGTVTMIPLAALNAATREEFVARLGGIFEHSPWVAERAWEGRPFATRAALHAAMLRATEEAGPERRLALLRAHPELAGRAAVRGDMTDYSQQEQGGSGLLDCSPEEFAQLQTLNRRYVERFGFPFILAVRGLDRGAIIAAFARRVEQEPEAEMREALRQIARITSLRLEALVEERLA